MGGLLKKALFFILGIAALLAIAAISLFLFLDTSDFREDISAKVYRATGRELVIEGELKFSVFPSLGIEMGRTRLSNADGYSDEPFASFEQARLSVLVLPMLLRREIIVNTAVLDSLHLNLEVTRSGRGNWQDLIDASEGTPESVESSDSDSAVLDIANIVIRNASLNYVDEQVGESYRLSEFNVTTGRVVAGEPIAVEGGFKFEQPAANLAGEVNIEANLSLTSEAIAMDNLVLVLDDTTFKGQLSLASDAAETISINLAADTIDLDRYMASAEDSTSAGDQSAPVEIPVDLIRSLSVQGGITFDDVTLSGMRFSNVTLGIDAANGNMRLHPISADFFGGKYEGDVRIDVRGDKPVLSVNESIGDVDLSALAVAVFEEENITGRINGSFKLSGRGRDLAAIQRDLSGSMSMELLDGTWEGTDVWYELRRARALYKKEPAPEQELPARTRFSIVKASGPVTDGVFNNDDLLVEMPFLRLTGKGSVDLVAATVDYRMSARVLERPEFAQGATEEELREFTEAVIPLKVRGPLADPSIKPDVKKMLRKQAKEEARDRVKDSLKDLFGS